jgi:CubicO group peptidase (beta-lactamase class C family)
MSEFRVPGLSIAVIRDGRIAWRKGFGVRDDETKAPVTNDTVFEAGSMSKPVFAYTVMKLCERGIIDLDTPLTKYTTEKFVEGDPRLDLITPRRILSHTTGLPNWRSKEEPLKLYFTPGEKWSYSGEGYYYLQSVITRLVGHTDARRCGAYAEGYRVCASNFGDFMAANLLHPFYMTSSGYVWTEAIGRNLARRHDKDGLPEPLGKPSAVDVARYGAAGSLLTTPSDYARFLIEVIHPKPPDVFRLNHASLTEMLRPQIEIPTPPNTPYRDFWALGWHVVRSDRGEIINHNGDNEGAHCVSLASVERRSGIVLMTNGENGLNMIDKRLLRGPSPRFV